MSFRLTDDQQKELDGTSSAVDQCLLPSGPYLSMPPSKAGVYRQNRWLRFFHPDADDQEFEPVKHGVSHTFIFTTNDDGTLRHTYSWGNEYDDSNPSHWYMDRDEDVAAAKKALGSKSSKLGEKVGGPDLVDHIDKAYDDLHDSESESPSAHGNWLFFNNCKTEATRLVDRAKEGLDAGAKSGKDPPNPSLQAL
jgi:hypothetical protein